MTNLEEFAKKSVEGSPCKTQDGKPGVWQNGQCVRPEEKSAEDNDFNLLSSEKVCSPSLQAEDGEEPLKLELGERCTDKDGKPGIWDNGNCNTGNSVLDSDFDLLSLENDRSRSLQATKLDAQKPKTPEEGESCTVDDKPGTWKNGQCVPNN